MGTTPESIDMGPYSLRAFALDLWQAGTKSAMQPPKSSPISLAFNVDVVTPRPAEGASTTPTPSSEGFDSHGATLPAEMLPATMQTEGVTFNFGHAGAANAVACKGQTISLPTGKFNRVYLLAAASDGEAKVTFKVGDSATDLTVQDWSGYIGLTDNRIWKLADQPEFDHDWHARLNGLAPAYIRTDPVAWYSSHRHAANRSDEIYQYCYLFKYRIDLPANATTLTLPNEPRVKILAASAAYDENDVTTPPTEQWPWEGVAFSGPELPPYTELPTKPAKGGKHPEAK